MNKSPETWDAALHRILDVLASSAQPRVNLVGDIDYLWGEHVRDVSGDNTGQNGVHGTAMAIRAFAAGVKVLGERSRYAKFLNGGAQTLCDWVQNPKKSTDFAKTTKVGEWIAALSTIDAYATQTATLIVRLLKGRNNDLCGWGWNISQPSSNPVVVPTLYALEGLCAAWTRSGEFFDVITSGIGFCLGKLEATQPPKTEDEERSLQWKSALYKLCEIISIAENNEHLDTSFRSRVCKLLDDAANPWSLSLKDFTRFEYRLKLETIEDHAYCVLPSGFIQLWALAWLYSGGNTTDPIRKHLIESIELFGRIVYSPSGFKLDRVETCSYAIRFITEFRSKLDLDFAEPNLDSENAISHSLSVLSPSKVRNYDDKSGREELYKRIFQRDQVSEINIIQELTDGYSGAIVDLCDVMKLNVVPEILQVFKLDETEASDAEVKGFRLAENLIDPAFRVSLLDVKKVPRRGLSIVRFNFAGLNLVKGQVQNLLRFLESEADLTEIGKTIDNIFDRALGNCHTATIAHPTLEKIREYFEGVRKNKFWSEINDGFERLSRNRRISDSGKFKRVNLYFPATTVANPLAFEDDKLWTQSFTSAEAAYGHGDLNPRNVLMIRSSEPIAGSRDYYQPVLIDFNRFSAKVPLAIDFARLEAGIMVKGLKSFITKAGDDMDAHEILLNFEETVNGSFEFAKSKTPLTSFPSEIWRFHQLVRAIRDHYESRFPSSSRKNVDPRSYFAVLMLNYLSYLRPVYADVLNNEQKLFSFYAASKIFERFFMK